MTTDTTSPLTAANLRQRLTRESTRWYYSTWRARGAGVMVLIQRERSRHRRFRAPCQVVTETRWSVDIYRGDHRVGVSRSVGLDSFGTVVAWAAARVENPPAHPATETSR